MPSPPPVGRVSGAARDWPSGQIGTRRAVLPPVGRGHAGEDAQVFHRAHEAPQRLDRGRAEARYPIGRGGGLPDRDPDGRGVRDDAPQRGLPEAAARRVGDAREADDVEGVGEQREVGDRVLDLGALVELRAADHLVGDLAAHERVLEHARHRVRAVEHRDLGARGALVDEPLDLADDEARLGVLVLELAHVDRLAGAQFAPQALGDAAAVVRDHGVGRGEDRLGRAVVLLELDDARVGEVLLEVEDVADVGVAEAVDRLRVVADDGEVAVSGELHALAARRRLAAPDQQLQEAVLRVVGVLVLVDEDVAEARGVALADVLEELEQVDGAEQQVVEVHRVHAQQVALVEAVDLGDHLLEGRADLLPVGLGVEQAVLGGGELVVDRGGRVALGVDPDGVHAALGQPPRVGLVVDRELARVAQALGLGAQDARAGSVEGHQPHPARAASEQALDPVAHLAGGLVGERDREDLAGLRLVGVDEVREAMRQHPRLAAAGAGEDQERPLAVRDGLALGLVEPLQQLLEVLCVRVLRHQPSA